MPGRRHNPSAQDPERYGAPDLLIDEDPSPADPPIPVPPVPDPVIPEPEPEDPPVPLPEPEPVGELHHPAGPKPAMAA